MKELIEALQTSPLLSGGLFVMLFGGILAYLRNVPYFIWKLIVRNFTNKISFVEGDSTYLWVEKWFHDNYQVNYGQYFLRTHTHNNKSNVNSYCWVPNYTWYFKRFDGKLLLIVKEKENGSAIDTRQLTTFRDRIDIYVFGNKEALSSLIKKMYDSYISSVPGISIYSAAAWNGWNFICYKKYAKKPVLEQYDYLKKDLKNFYDSEDVYAEKGINWKRVYLFYGLPGTGKTTTIVSLAHEFKKDIHMLSLSNESTEAGILSLISSINPNSVVVIEDIDCFEVSNNRKTVPEKTDPRFPIITPAGSSLNLSTLLNILDGIYTPHGIVFFLTSNRKEFLDKALIRPGRVDIQVEYKEATKNQVEGLYNKLSTKKHLFQDFYIKNSGIKTMAEAQELILQDNLL